MIDNWTHTYSFSLREFSIKKNFTQSICQKWNGQFKVKQKSPWLRKSTKFLRGFVKLLGHAKINLAWTQCKIAKDQQMCWILENIFCKLCVSTCVELTFKRSAMALLFTINAKRKEKVPKPILSLITIPLHFALSITRYTNWCTHLRDKFTVLGYIYY